MVAITAISVVYGLLAFLLPHPYPTFDEAKYLAIGQNALAGLGPLTAFGARFLPHAPLWAMMLAAPKVALGLDPWTWGRLLNAIAGTAILLLSARFVSRYGRAAMLLAVSILVGWIDLFLLTRTARLDVPEAALALAYLAVAMSAIETGLVRRGILAGVLFAWAFLTKEASLVLLAAPFIAGIAVRQPLGRVARAAGLVLLAAIPLVSWWFGWYASATGTVFAFGLRSAILPPLAVVLLVAGAGLVGAGLDRPMVVRVRAPLEARLADRRMASAVASILTIGWMIAFLVAFSRSEVQAGRPLFDLPNIARWGRTWVWELGPILVAGAGGIAAIVAMTRGDGRAAELLVALAAGSTWVLLVAVLGEPPRNDIAELAIVVALGSGGWLMIGTALSGRRQASWIAATGLGALVALVIQQQAAWAGLTLPRLGNRGGALAAVAAGAVIAGSLASMWGRRRLATALRPVLGVSATNGRSIAVVLVTALAVGSLGAASARVLAVPPATTRGALADSVAGWLTTNLPAGSTVMFGSVQSNETATVLGATFPLRHLQAVIGVTAPAAPLGVSVGGKPVPDLVVMDRHPRQDGYLVFTAAAIGQSLRGAAPAAIVYVTGLDTATPSMVDWMASAPGITLVATLTSPPGGPALTARIYRVDLAALAIPADRTYASAPAIEALLDGIAGSPDAAAIAAALLDRIVITDPGAAADAAMARLRSAAGR